MRTETFDIHLCSVPCYKQHKETSCSKPAEGTQASVELQGRDVLSHQVTIVLCPLATEEAVPREEPPLEEPALLRPLTSLKWPYILDESAYPDPLKRDDPKTLKLHQYEAIATSASTRKLLTANPNLKNLLISIDSLRGQEREDALQRALGVGAPDVRDLSAHKELSQDMLTLREFAEAIESAVRGGQEGVLGLDWDSNDL
ncbi:hypothetical protein H0H92_015394 [Tricholoma furcatifolium]|nr:hypothetical protein H0H92_015394 [Tricholoma furcatifolium]